MLQQDDTNNFPIINYLKIFFRRKEIFIVCAFLGLVVGICSGILIPKEYKSESVILVEEGKTDNPLFNSLAVSTTVSERLATIREAMLGWNSVDKLVKRLSLDQEIKTTKQYEALIKKIQNSVDIKMRGDKVLYITAFGDDPVNTQAIVKNITDIFIERNQEIQDRETQDAISFIEEQLKVYKGKIMSAEIAEMQNQMDEMLLDSTEKHPVVRQLKEKIEARRTELQASNLEYTNPDKLELETTVPIINTIKSALENLETKGAIQKSADAKDEMAKVMLMEKLNNVSARDAGVNIQIYNTLLQRLETAKITQRLQASKEGTRYTIVEPPRVPLEPYKPNKIMIAIAGLVLGGIIGFGLIVACEFLDKSFLDVEDAKEFLGGPLLGAISKINTVETLRQESDRERWIYSLTFVGGLVAIVVTVTVSNFLK